MAAATSDPVNCWTLDWIAKLERQNKRTALDRKRWRHPSLQFTPHKALRIVTIIESTLLDNIGGTLLGNIESSLLHRLRRVELSVQIGFCPPPHHQQPPSTRNVENHLYEYVNLISPIEGVQLGGFNATQPVRHKATDSLAIKTF